MANDGKQLMENQTSQSAAQSMFLDLNLARRVEWAEAQAAVDCAKMLQQTDAATTAAYVRVAGGYAVYCGANSPITQAVGVGLDGPVSDEEFEQLEAFYRERGEPVRVETCPMADASLFEHYGKHGYRATEFTNVMARRVGNLEPFALAEATATGRTLEKCDSTRVDLWALSVAQGFAEYHAVTEDLLQVMRMFARGPNTECYLARVDGKVAGGAALILRDGVAGLFGASTLPAFRKRGVQTALLHARLRRGVEAGCELAVCLAQVGGGSQRNIVRQGFQVLYTRVKFEKNWDTK